MEFIGPYGVPAGSPYVQGDAAADIKGSYLNIHAVTDPMTEIINVIEMSGLTRDGDDLTQLYQAIGLMIASRTLPAGAVVAFDLDNPPPGFIVGDGSAILRASYSRLDAAKYVGDADNATATAWYRCTNPSSPSTSRSITGAYLVTRDLRGEFPRFLDAGRGVDPGRYRAGTLQAQQTAKHKHIGSIPMHNDYTWGGNSVLSVGSGANGSVTTSAAYAPWTDDGTGTMTPKNGGTVTNAPNAAGVIGDETRPRNIALLGCIKI